MRDNPVRQVYLLLTILLAGAGTALRADTPEAAAGDGTGLPSWMLAQNEPPPPDDTAPPQGRLLLRNSLQPQEEQEERYCMTVCAAWGEDCTFINRGMGGTTRTCRRVCQQFTEECF